MLVLTRHVGGQVMIGDDVIVTVLGFRGNQIKLGIEAPEGVTVHRREIYDRINGTEEVETAEAARESKPAQATAAVCKCDFRTRIVGDGCAVCNPGGWQD